MNILVHETPGYVIKNTEQNNRLVFSRTNTLFSRIPISDFGESSNTRPPPSSAQFPP